MQVMSLGKSKRTNTFSFEQKKGKAQLVQFRDNRKMKSSCINFLNNKSLEGRASIYPLQRAILGNINCPNIGTPQAIGNAIHHRLEVDYLVNGNIPPAHPAWVKGVEFPVPTGQVPDLSLRTPALNIIRSVGEIKPVGNRANGVNQIAVHLGNVVANQFNPATPLINDNGWAAGAAFPVADLDPAANSPTGMVNVWQDAAVNGLYLYNG